MEVKTPVNVSVFCPNRGMQLPPSVFPFIFQGLENPLVIRGQLGPWMESRSWDPLDMCNYLGSKGKTSTFKVCPKKGTSAYHNWFGRGSEQQPIFETQCEYVEASFTDFADWLSQRNKDPTTDEDAGGQEPATTDEDAGGQEPASKRTKLEDTCRDEETRAQTVVALGEVEKQCTSGPPRVNPLMKYPRDEHWVYADYKYMCQLCEDFPDLLSSVDWGLFGFKGRTGQDSTLWIGSEGAHTPCHYDTYGCNVVAQLSGEKKWTLFSPGDSDSLFPTRVPYEESSVFSRVNVTEPDLVKFKIFTNATPYVIVLRPGDLLYVPEHWWHYVESIDPLPTVSINMWFEQSSFPHQRLKEAIVRTLVTEFSKDPNNPDLTPDWINPNEVLFPVDENLKLLHRALADRRLQLAQVSSEGSQPQCLDVDQTASPVSSKNGTDSRDPGGTDTGEEATPRVNTKEDGVIILETPLSVQDFVKVITCDRVVSIIADCLLDEFDGTVS